jgi:hypothetical protein
MPEKEGAEEKSTKSVVNKKQKQMMGEEGYDHLRDMGRIRKNKDKKDATTMPPSKEMEKTRKVNKGPSALEVVKKKYKGQIMKMEELDLTKVAESFGGYIVEKITTSGDIFDAPKVSDREFGGSIRAVKKVSAKTRRAKREFQKDLKSTGEKISRPDEIKLNKRQPLPKVDFPPTVPPEPDRYSSLGSGSSMPRPGEGDASTLKDVKKTKQTFAQQQQKIKSLKKSQADLKTKVDKVGAYQDVERRIARVEKGVKAPKGGFMKKGTDLIKSMKKKGGEVLSRFGKSASGTGASTDLVKSGAKSPVSKAVARDVEKRIAKVGAKTTGRTAAKKIGQKAVQKAGQKALTKGIAKSAAKAIPGVGSLLSGIEAAGRLAKGDVGGAALSAGEAIPGVGLGFAGLNVARDVSRAKKAAGAIKTIGAGSLRKAAAKGAASKKVGSQILKRSYPKGAREVSVGKGMEIVGSRRDKSIQLSKEMGAGLRSAINNPIVQNVGGAVGGKTIEKTSRGIKSGKLPTTRGGRVGRRSAKS